jgi:S1-C subfamily serine protease
MRGNDAMKRASAYGLALLAVSAAATLTARAWNGDSQSAVGSASAQFFMSGAGAPTRGGQGYLGVDLRDVTADQLAALKLKDTRGAEIILVDHDAPAGKAGLREHDVVLQMNGQPIENQDQLRRLLHDSPPGKTLALVISRDGQPMTVTTQMSTHEEVDREALENRLTVPEPQVPPSDSALSGNSADPSPIPSVRDGDSFIGTMVMNPAYTGLYLEKMTTQLASFFGVPSGAGLLVCSVQPNSPAATAGMQAGDVVIRADKYAVITPNDWAKAIKNSHGQPLTVVVLRDKKQQTLTLTPDGRKRSSLEQPGDDSTRTDLAHLGMSWMPRS